MRYTREKLIQLIHIAKHKLAMDDITYKQMLSQLTGEDSCSKLKVAQLMLVYTEMEKKGFKPTSKGKKSNNFYSPRTSSATVRHDIAHKIRAVWIDMYKSGFIRDGSESALNQFVRNTANAVMKEKGSTLIFLNAGSLDYETGAIVLERLKQWRKREVNKLRKGTSE
ncbi:TPA: regulatory protein GemA [Pasteurella multocida]|nr:regulatory protein GemA [Pasteurella multocida]HDR1014622.1 regulatory protein GemA [Pasteurella multocida]HDR1017029.1 regulatory protein GemA [Pasteurella multocida]HDR1125611.1 regulatory protein GemA [Pasteurella multocida]HDR1208666.1 regulatory protein GemA [Pasteurella multocida]